MSSAASGASQLASTTLSTCVLHALSSAGFSSTSSRAQAVLTDVLKRYLETLARTAAEHALHGRRTAAVPVDVIAALEELGSHVEELSDWARMEKEQQAGDGDMDAAQNTLLAAAAAEDLQARRRHGRLTVHLDQLPSYHYHPILPADRAELLNVQWENEARVEEMDVSSGDESRNNAKERPNGVRRRVSGNHKRRRIAKADSEALEVDYVESFLPPFPPGKDGMVQTDAGSESEAAEMDPDASSDEDGSPATPRTCDVEYEQERMAAVKIEGSAVSLNLDLVANLEAGEKTQPLNPWDGPLSYEHSSLAEVQTMSDIPSLSKEISGSTSLGKAIHRTSSLYAFAADYATLCTESANSAGPLSLLTPPGSTHANALAKRRVMARVVADPGRYTVQDSMYSALPVRPSTIPFVPGPSILITKSSAAMNGLAPPDFTPVLPHGRPTAQIPPSGALAPALSYRHSSHASSCARSISSTMLIRRVTRLADPAPLRDEHHAERVFHGTPISRDLLESRSGPKGKSIKQEARDDGKFGPGNSFLAGALNTLRNRQVLALATTAAPGVNGNDVRRIEPPKAATLVQTWDWTERDPTDSTLPVIGTGRRHRAERTNGQAPANEADVEMDSDAGEPSAAPSPPRARYQSSPPIDTEDALMRPLAVQSSTAPSADALDTSNVESAAAESQVPPPTSQGNFDLSSATHDSTYASQPQEQVQPSNALPSASRSQTQTQMQPSGSGLIGRMHDSLDLESLGTQMDAFDNTQMSSQFQALQANSLGTAQTSQSQGAWSVASQQQADGQTGQEAGPK